VVTSTALDLNKTANEVKAGRIYTVKREQANSTSKPVDLEDSEREEW
jgi:hypothetical protein